MPGAVKPNDLGSRVAQALGEGRPSKQPVTNAGKVGSEPSNSNAIKSRDGMASWKQRQKGTPNRSYPVEVVNKARAKMGGNSSASY